MLECTEIQQVASRAAAGLKAHAKNSLRLSSPLAKNVWLVNFRENAEPLARLLRRHSVSIPLWNCCGKVRRVFAPNGHDKKFFDEYESENNLKVNLDGEPTLLKQFRVECRQSRFRCVSAKIICVEPSQGRLTTTAIPARHVQQRTFGVKPILSQRRWIKCCLPILVWQ